MGWESIGLQLEEHLKNMASAWTECVPSLTTQTQVEQAIDFHAPTHTFGKTGDDEVPQTFYTDKDGDVVRFTCEEGYLLMHVNDTKCAGEGDTTGVVTELWYKKGEPCDIRTQHRFGNSDFPWHVVMMLKKMAEGIGVPNNLPEEPEPNNLLEEPEIWQEPPASDADEDNAHDTTTDPEMTEADRLEA